MKGRSSVWQFKIGQLSDGQIEFGELVVSDRLDDSIWMVVFHMSVSVGLIVIRVMRGWFR